MRRFLLMLAIVLIVVIGLAVARTLEASGYFATLERVDTDCARLEAPKGPEDIALDRDAGLIFISSTDRRAIFAGNTEVRGDIYVMRVSAPQEGAISLTSGFGDAPSDFRPHGISFFQDNQGRKTLMVVNHPETGDHTVEIFDIVSDSFGGVKLDHRRTVSDPQLISPNDVVAVDHDRFYATNDHGNAPGTFWNQAETWLILPLANVVYWDGRDMREVANGLSYANGIAASGDGNTIYAAETTARSLRVYARNTGTGALSLKQTIFMGVGPDNVDVDPGGNVWVASHPKLLDLNATFSDPNALSPSQVSRIALGPRGLSEPVTVYLSMGRELSGSSTAIASGDTLFITNILDPKMLVCRMGAR